jgi:hypothetical protein
METTVAHAVQRHAEGLDGPDEQVVDLLREQQRPAGPVVVVKKVAPLESSPGERVDSFRTTDPQVAPLARLLVWHLIADRWCRTTGVDHAR